MSRDANLIEVCFSVEMPTTVAFWMDRETWNNLSKEQKAERVEKAFEAACANMSDNIEVSFDDMETLGFDQINICGEIFSHGPESIYDPEEPDVDAFGNSPSALIE